MRQQTHARAIVVTLLVLCLAIAAVLSAKSPAATPTVPTEQPASPGGTEPQKGPAGTGESAAVPAEPLATTKQAPEPAKDDDPTASTPDPTVSDGSTTASGDASPVAEELQRQVAAVIPHAERPKIDPDAEYEPDVVLVSVREGTTPEQLSQAMADSGITSVEHDGIEAVTDDLMMARLAPDATIDDAVYALESTGVAKGAQPNYVYEIADEQTPSSGDATPTDGDATTTGSDDAAPGGGAPGASDDPTPSEKADAPDERTAPDEPKAPDAPATPDAPNPTAVADDVQEQPDAQPTIDAQHAQSDAQPTIDVQATSPTAARNALNDEFASRQWDLDSIDALDAWEYPPLKSTSTTIGVGILDNGFDHSHEDLADNVRSTYNATTNDENVPVPCPPGTPNANHGSHVAGIVAATSNNEKGIGGVGFNHLKLSLVCLTSESNPSGISTADVVRGLDYLIAHRDQYNIRVANMSVGTRVGSMPKDDAILNKVDEAYGKGIVMVASGGNRTGSAIPPYINYPSDYETIVSVVNLRNTNDDPKSVSLSDTSNFNAPGETSKNISAPGTNIYSTYLSGYGDMSGTSMAAPHVAGVMGLMFAVNPMLSAAQAKNLLYSSARDIGAEGWDETYGHGEVNAFAAVRAAAAGTITGPEYLAVGSETTYVLGPDYTGWAFRSSNPGVLEMTEDGRAKAASAGIVTVSAGNGTLDVVQQVTVLGPVAGSELVAKDGSASLSIATPDGCGNLAWEWGSDDESVANVSSNGVIYGKGVGTATITATLVSDPTVRLSHAVTVYETQQSDVCVPVEGSVALTPVFPSGFASPTFDWASSNGQVATVDQDGIVTAICAGGTVVSCTITQGEDSVTNAWRVYAYGPIEGAARVGVGQSTQLKLAGIGNVSPDLQAGWTWSLGDGSDGAVASVSADGTVTGRKPGTVKVIASRGSGQELVSFSHDMTVTTTLECAQVTIPRQTYSGSKLTPVPVVTLDGVTLVAGTDYDMVDQDIVNAGFYDVTVQGKGSYQGRANGAFVVEPLRLKPPKPATGLVYDGSPQRGVPEGDGYVLRGDVTATDADEYLAFAEVADKANTRWEDNTPSYRIEWSIGPRPASELSVTGLDPCVYDGTAHTPKPTVAWNGKVLKEGDDYAVAYAGNVNAGTATATITCEDGNFKGTVTCPFVVLKAACSVGTVTAEAVRDSLDPADVQLTRSDASVPGRLAITESELSYGTNTYHWVFTPDDANHEPSSGTVEVTVTGHEWGAPTYEWAEGDASCTARRVCAYDPAHTEEETVVPTRRVVAETTSKSEGKATLTAEFRNAAFQTQSKEVSLPKLPADDEPAPRAGRLGSRVAMAGDGPSVEMQVPDGLVESMLTDEEKERVASGTDASLVATVAWLGTGDVPTEDLAALSKDGEARKVSMGWEAYLRIDLCVRVGDTERKVTQTDKPIAFEVRIDPKGTDAVSKGLAQAIADGKADGAITVRRVHEGAVSEVGSAKRGEAARIESDRFSTFALGSAAVGGAASEGGAGPATQPTKPSSQAASGSAATGPSASGSATTEPGATRLAGTSDGSAPAGPLVAAGMAALALAALRHRPRA